MTKKIFIIAGEASGDWLGAKLLRELRALAPGAEISGIGGPKMEAVGFVSLFPMHEISLMGFAEIVPHIFNLKNRIRQTVAEIGRLKPDVVVTIDSSGFNFRVATAIQHMRPATRLVHYVAPMVWVYKEKRALKVNRLFDKQLCILPFEPKYFTNAEFIGHPSLEDGLDSGDGAAFKARHNVDDFVCLMPGSRRGEVKKLLPVFLQAAELLGKKPVIIAADNVVLPTNALVVNNSEKLDCFAASACGIIKSGTSGLEYGFAGKPYVIAYKTSAITAWLARRLIKIKYLNLVNVMFNREIVPEMLQEKCNAPDIAAALSHSQDFDKAALVKMLENGRGIAPSKLAASIVIST